MVLSASSNIVGWWGTRIKENLEAALGLATFVDNDVNVISMGEHAFGAARGYNDFVCMALGSGVGGCVFLDGAIRRGSRGAAGELGHLTVDVNGRLCNCGRVGCLEMYVSAWAIAERARMRIAAGFESLISELAEGDLERIESRHVFEAAESGDSLGTVIVGEVGRMLAAALADLANLVDPALFVIAGGVAQAGEPLRARIEEEPRVAATVGPEPCHRWSFGQPETRRGCWGRQSRLQRHHLLTKRMCPRNAQWVVLGVALDSPFVTGAESFRQPSRERRAPRLARRSFRVALGQSRMELKAAQHGSQLGTCLPDSGAGGERRFGLAARLRGW